MCDLKTAPNSARSRSPISRAKSSFHWTSRQWWRRVLASVSELCAHSATGVCCSAASSCQKACTCCRWTTSVECGYARPSTTALLTTDSTRNARASRYGWLPPRPRSVALYRVVGTKADKRSEVALRAPRMPLFCRAGLLVYARSESDKRWEVHLLGIEDGQLEPKRIILKGREVPRQFDTRVVRVSREVCGRDIPDEEYASTPEWCVASDAQQLVAWNLERGSLRIYNSIMYVHCTVIQTPRSRYLRFNCTAL